MYYDNQEEFVLSDGGTIIISYKGQSFCDIEGENKQNLILFIVGGLTSDCNTGYMVNIVKIATENSYDCVVINYRGMTGATLTTPQIYNFGSYKDVLEPMKYVYEKYCSQTSRPAFALGCSMGANILTNVIGHQGEACFLKAAFLIQAPMQIKMCIESIVTSMNGIFNKKMGEGLLNVYQRHQNVLREHM